MTTSSFLNPANSSPEQDKIRTLTPVSTQRPSSRSQTDPPYPAGVKRQSSRVKKRIVLCCDGTWKDGITVTQRWKYTNILRLARAINHVDERFEPPIPQIVFYQSGIGTANSTVFQTLLDGATGATLAEKVQEAYAFLAHNYQPGDDVLLFGFSRGAYTARMVASIIGEIGILDKIDMDHFAEIYVAYQKRGKADPDSNSEEIQKLDEQLHPWNQKTSPGRVRADTEDGHFSIQCVGVFDTVGSVGLPEEFIVRPKMRQLFGFNDRILGYHIARAYHALALNETRKDFDCTKFEQTEKGKKKNQVLKQCWFAGSHSDIGGGYEFHDLSDVSLFWMAANVSDILSLDTDYLLSLPDPATNWGEQAPHDSASGIYTLANRIHRNVMTVTDEVTKESVHASALQQSDLDKTLVKFLRENPDRIAKLLPLEEQVKAKWTVEEERGLIYSKSVDEDKNVIQDQNEKKSDHEDDHPTADAQAQLELKTAEPRIPGVHARSPPKALDNKENEVVHGVKELGKRIGFGVHHAASGLTHFRSMSTESGEPLYEENWLGKMIEESHMSEVLKEVFREDHGVHHPVDHKKR